MKKFVAMGMIGAVLVTMQMEVSFAKEGIPSDIRGRWYERYVVALESDVADMLDPQGRYYGNTAISAEDFITLSANALEVSKEEIASFFAPDQKTITREQMVLLIEELGRICNMDTTQRSYAYEKPNLTDYNQLSEEAKQAYDFASRNGYITTREGNFRPQDFLTRGEAAIILSKMKEDFVLTSTYMEQPSVFLAEEISPAYAEKMNGISYVENDGIAIEDLRLLTMSYYGFDENIHTGQMVVHKDIAQDTLGVFEEMFQKKCPIERMIPIDRFGAKDALSMNANNSSSFCYRVVAGTTRLSNHAMGQAVDINPIQNPWMKNVYYDPEIGAAYEDRHDVRQGMVVYGDDYERAFYNHGFDWAGDWQTPIDIQHFEKKPGNTQRENVKKAMEKMTLEEKVAQLFILDFSKGGTFASSLASEEMLAYSGGLFFSPTEKNVLLYQQQIEAVLTASVQEKDFVVKPLIAIREMPQTKAAQGEDFRGAMKEVAVSLAERGYTLNCINNTATQSKDLAQAAQFTKVGAQALQENKVYGAIPLLLEDTTATASLEQLKASDFFVAQGAIDRNVAFLTVPHVSLPKVTGNEKSIATSPKMMELIRQELGFRKVILVDCLDEAYEAEFGVSPETALDCILAGADMVMIPEDKEIYVQAVLDAVSKGILTEQRIEESLYRILDVKIS